MEVQVKLLGDVKFEVSARSHSLVSDQPAENGGQDEGMTPAELFIGGLGSCAAYYAAAFLRKRELPREGVSVRVSAEKAGPPARLDHFKIEVLLPFSLSEANLAAMDEAVHRCLIHNTLLHTPTVEIAIRPPALA